MQHTKRSILCVDDNEDNLELLKFLFADAGFDVTACDSLDDCLYYARSKTLDAIVLDNRFGEKSSLETCEEIRAFNPDIPIVFYSGETRQQEIDRAMQLCGNAYLFKPNDFDKLTGTVKRLIDETQVSA